MSAPHTTRIYLQGIDIEEAIPTHCGFLRAGEDPIGHSTVSCP
jgi:hypothetical protein